MDRCSETTGDAYAPHRESLRNARGGKAAPVMRRLGICLTTCVLLGFAAGCTSSTVVTPPNGTSPVVPTPTPTAAPMPVYHLVYNFETLGGSAPVAGLTSASGVLYGTTSGGGGNDFGTVFSVGTSGSGFAVLHAFGSSGDGTHPFGTAIEESGSIFSTTAYGGTYAHGIVFSVSDDGKIYQVLHHFGATPTDGIGPFAGLTPLDDAFYRTTSGGGTNDRAGTVFSIASNGSNYAVLHDFGKGTDGKEPAASLTAVNGVLYGSTLYGGTFGCAPYVECGTIFRIDASGAERVLHNFGATGDGNGPQAALIVVGSTLYGTTFWGGTNGQCSDGHGVREHCGTVFRIDANGKSYAVLHDFGKGSDGTQPDGSLIEINGTLYGTTSNGGASGFGTIFSLNSDGTNYHVVHSFGAIPDGQHPVGALTTANGAIYGTTAAGGSTQNGIVFSLTF